MEGHWIFNIILMIRIATLPVNPIKFRKDVNLVSNVKLAPNVKMTIVCVLWKWVAMEKPLVEILQPLMKILDYLNYVENTSVVTSTKIAIQAQCSKIWKKLNFW